MQSGVSDFADGVKPVNIGAPVLIDHHTAAGVVRRGHHRYRFTSEIDAKPQQLFINRREVLADKRLRFVADVEIHAVGAETFHFMVNGARHDIARCQFGALVKLRHKAGAVRAFKISPFATQRFGQQKIARLGMKQGGWMELIEFEIRNATTGAPGHRDAVARGDIRVGRVLIDF